MPVKLGLTAAGGVASALGGSGKAGPTSTANTVSTNTGNTTSSTNQSGTATPNLNPLMSGFQSSLVPALSQMYAKAQQPIYGAQQIAAVANNGDAATDAASSALSSNLARRGILNSGASAAGQTQLQANNVANTTNFENQIPLLNTQNEEAQTNNVLGLAEGLTGKALSTNVQTGTGTGSNTSFGMGNNTATAAGPAFGSGVLNSLGEGLQGAGKGGGGKTPTSGPGSPATPGAWGDLLG
jgi:hypothetical protein